MNARRRSLLAAALLAAVAAAPALAADGAPTAPGASTSLSTPLARAEAAAARNDWGEVEGIAREWEQGEPREILPPLILSQALNNQGKWAESAAAARRSLERGESPAARFYLGVALGALGELAAAEKELRRSVELAPKNGPSLRLWAGSLANRGRYAEAASAMERARAVLPPELKLDDQLDYYRRAGAWKFPPAALEQHGLAGWLLERERWGDAAEAYRAALKVAPAFADCHYHLGWALHQLGEDAAAEKEYRAAIAGYGKAEAMFAADARYNLAQNLFARRRAAEAVPLLREAIALRGERYWLLHALGNACRADGDSRCAREAWEKILGSHEELPDGLLDDVKRALAEVGGATEVKEEKALKTGGAVDEGAARRCDHGVVLAEQGRREEARREFEEALAKAPEFGFCRLNLALALVQSGDAAGAERQVRQALASKAPSTVDEGEERRWRAQGRFFLAQLLTARSGSPREVVSLVREAAATLGESPFMAFVLGAACDAAGDRPCAVDATRRALQGREQLSEANVASAEKLLRLLGVSPAPAP